MELFIRPYQKKDRTAVFDIAADTAFFGEAVEAFMEDRRLFCDSFCAYYTDYEPQNSWVAEIDHNVVGYLLGCENSASRSYIWWRAIAPSLLKRILAGKYQIGACTWKYIKEISAASIRGEMTHADIRRFPAHLHINVSKVYRGEGIGKHLMESYLNELSEKGVIGVHLNTTSENRAACSMYEKLGFELLDRRVTKLWRSWLGYEIENRCYGLEIR